MSYTRTRIFAPIPIVSVARDREGLFVLANQFFRHSHGDLDRLWIGRGDAALTNLAQEARRANDRADAEQLAADHSHFFRAQRASRLHGRKEGAARGPKPANGQAAHSGDDLSFGNCTSSR